MNGLGIERRRAGMTQRIASEKSGIPLSTIRRWEQGVNEPDVAPGFPRCKLAAQKRPLPARRQGGVDLSGPQCLGPATRCQSPFDRPPPGGVF